MKEIETMKEKIGSKKTLVVLATVFAVGMSLAQAVLPGYVTDSTAGGSTGKKEECYRTPEYLKYPYISTYYVKPTVMEGEDAKLGFFVTDFESSKIRFLDDSHRFQVFLEYRKKGGASKTITLENLKSGDGEFNIGKLPAGDYELRVWAVDGKGRQSHRVIHDFRVVSAKDISIPDDKVYVMSAGDLVAYGIRNDGDLEEVVYVGADGKRQIVRKKRTDAPGYTVTVPLDPATGKVPFKAYQKAKLEYDAGYDKKAVEDAAVSTAEGIQKLLDEKAAKGFRRFVMLPGTYRISSKKSIFIPDGMTLDLGDSVFKQNGFTGAASVLVRFSSVKDAHLVGGTLEGDYWEHDYAASPKNSEWPAGFEIGGDAWYCSVDGVKVVDITGYGGQNGVQSDSKGWLSFFMENLPGYSPGGIDLATGIVDGSDKFRFTTDFKDIGKIVREHSRRRLQISKYLGYQGVSTRSWQVTVAWYDSGKKFISAETAWQYREMWIPEGAMYLRVSVEADSVEAADKSGLVVTAMRLPVNCVVKNCRFEHCRCVGYAASAMKNMLFEGNYFTRSGESAACCAFDAEDGWDQMQDVYFLGNVFRDNPRNNSILTCAGHNFILEKNDGDIYFWGRTHSPCVRGNIVGEGMYRCDSRLRSGYGRFYSNTYKKAVHIGENDGKKRSDDWDYTISGLNLDGGEGKFAFEVGDAGRIVKSVLRNLPISIANAQGCVFSNCTDASTYKPFPGGTWTDVKVEDCVFSRLFQSNRFERCRFVDTKLEKFGGFFSADKCFFSGCTLFGLNSAQFRFSGCDMKATAMRGNYWEHPATLVFKNCSIDTADDSAFLKLGVYSIGSIGFDKCTVSGGSGLVDVFDLRELKWNANAGSGENPDKRPGMIALRKTVWTSKAGSAITASRNNNPSSKEIVIVDRDNSWPAGVSAANGIPESWKIK